MTGTHDPADALNREILELLQEDARMSMTDLARRTGRAETTVRDRVRALEANGAIRGYRADVDPAALGYTTRATIRAQYDVSNVDLLALRLSRLPEVVEIELVSGDLPIAMRVRTETLDALDALVERLPTFGLTTINTSVILRKIKARGPVRLATKQAELALVAPEAV